MEQCNVIPRMSSVKSLVRIRAQTKQRNGSLQFPVMSVQIAETGEHMKWNPAWVPLPSENLRLPPCLQVVGTEECQQAALTLHDPGHAARAAQASKPKVCNLQGW